MVILVSTGIDNPVTMLNLESKRKTTTAKVSLLLKCMRITKDDASFSWHHVRFGEVGGVCNMLVIENKEAGSKNTKSDG